MVQLTSHGHWKGPGDKFGAQALSVAWFGRPHWFNVALGSHQGVVTWPMIVLILHAKSHVSTRVAVNRYTKTMSGPVHGHRADEIAHAVAC